MLNRAFWFDDLVSAHLLTGEKRYIDSFTSQFLDWVNNNPLPVWIDEKSPAWRLIDTGSRPYNSWISTFKLLVNSPYVDDATEVLMLKSLHDHAQFLFYFRTSGTNHVLIESKGLLKLADEFPEFQRAKLWREVAIRRLNSEILQQVYADGGHVELSPDYHFQSLNHFAFPLRQLSDAQAAVAPGYQDKVEAMRDFLFYTLKPDLRLPLLNDTNTKNVSKNLLSEARASEREDLLFISTHGEEGTSPALRSRAFEDSGVYVMRSDWTPQAQYLIFDAGSYGGWHGHEDKLSIEMSAYGTHMITDGGAYRYSGDDLYRKYFVSSAAHNTVLVDRLGQSRRLLEHNRRPERAYESEARNGKLWFSNDEFDFVSGIYRDGYSNMAKSDPGSYVIDRSVTHQRDIVYIKNDYFVVADTLFGSGTHGVELLYHLPPEALAHILGKSVTARYPNGATLNILTEGPGDRDVSIISGQGSPIQGWFSSADYEAVPAPAVSVSFKTELPATFYTVLAPSPPPGVNNSKTDIHRVKVLKTQCGKSDICLEVSSSESVDRIAFQSQRGGGGRLSVSDVANAVTLERRARKADTGSKPGVIETNQQGD